jgi:hypothetical protein
MDVRSNGSQRPYEERVDFVRLLVLPVVTRARELCLAGV